MLHAIMLFHIVVYADRAKMDHRHPAGSTARVAEHSDDHFNGQNGLNHGLTATVRELPSGQSRL